jgi:glycosyltransferase involved in cell wall biosynthesis
MRVLHVHSGNLWGGVETVLQTLAAERSAAPTLNAEFALCFNGPLRQKLSALGVVVHDLGPARWSRPHRLLVARRRLADLLASGGIDLVVTHSMWAHAMFAGVVCRSGVRLVHFAHDLLDGRDWLQRLARRTKPELVIANSRFTAASVPKVFPDTPIRVLYPPTALAQSRGSTDVRVETGTPADAVVIVQVSRLERWKGQEHLLMALGRLQTNVPWRCWIVGGSQRDHERAYLDSLKAMAHAQGIDHLVQFLGQRADVGDVLRSADVFCQPNIGPEPFGLVFIEALQAGLPIVTSAMGGGAEIVDGSCGALVPPDDLDALTTALRDLIEDPDRRQRLGAAGPARARDLSDPARRLADLEELLAGARAA